MKTLMISTLCAIALCSVQLGVSAKPAQADTLDRYVIDGTNVTDFDGSQLVGKTVKSYDVMTAKSGKTVYRIHTITTSPSLSDLRGKFSGMSLNLDALLDIFMKEAPTDIQRRALDYAKRALGAAVPAAINKYSDLVANLTKYVDGK